MLWIQIKWAIFCFWSKHPGYHVTTNRQPTLWLRILENFTIELGLCIWCQSIPPSLNINVLVPFLKFCSMTLPQKADRYLLCLTKYLPLKWIYNYLDLTTYFHFFIKWNTQLAKITITPFHPLHPIHFLYTVWTNWPIQRFTLAS